MPSTWTQRDLKTPFEKAGWFIPYSKWWPRRFIQKRRSTVLVQYTKREDGKTYIHILG